MAYPQGEYQFTIRAGQSVVDGKVYYPALLHLRMDRSEALRLLVDLANALGSQDQETICIHRSGTIAEVRRPE